MNTWKEFTRRQRDSFSPRTLVELLGQQRILVEHHRGIRGYGSEEIRVGATFGTLLIRGENLRLCCMSREQLFISGKITGIALEEQE